MAIRREHEQIGHSREVIAAVGALLTEARVSLHWTQGDAAERAGVDRQTWMFAERGERSMGRDAKRKGERPLGRGLVVKGERAIKIVDTPDDSLARMARAVGIPAESLIEVGRPAAASLLSGMIRAENARRAAGLVPNSERVHPALQRLNAALWQLGDREVAEVELMLQVAEQHAGRLLDSQRIPLQRGRVAA